MKLLKYAKQKKNCTNDQTFRISKIIFLRNMAKRIYYMCACPRISLGTCEASPRGHSDLSEAGSNISPQIRSLYIFTYDIATVVPMNGRDRTSRKNETQKSKKTQSKANDRPFSTSRGCLRMRPVAFRFAYDLHIITIVVFLYLVTCYMYKCKDVRHTVYSA